MAQPFLKWAGGKAKLAPLVAERAPAEFARYHEPFLGAGAVFFALASDRPLPAYLNDANAELIATFTVVRDATTELIEQLEELSEAYLRCDSDGRAAYYYRVRALDPTEPVSRAARLIFLNRTCYNGLYRVNSRGKFNVPHGRYKQPTIVQSDRLWAAAKALANADLAAIDFAAACDRAEPGDFVYFDPPYQPLSRTSNFTAYTHLDFGPEDQERLRDTFEALTRRGVAALLSNSDHEFVRELYCGRGYTLETVTMSRAINSKGSGRAPVPELLISNRDRAEVRDAFGERLRRS